MPTIGGEPTVESQRPFEGRLINLRVDTVRLPDGRLIRREIVEHSDCVCIVALDAGGHVVLVRQYRKPVETYLLEVPAGGIDPGETPEAAAGRELQEETGFRAHKLNYLNYFWTTPGYCTEGMYAYLATDLEIGSHDPDDDETIEVIKVSLDSIPDMVVAGDITDGKSIAALMLVFARNHQPSTST